MVVLVIIPIGITIGAVTWALIGGRGGFWGFALSVLANLVSAFIGGLGAQALSPQPTNATLVAGAVFGALLCTVIEVIGWGTPWGRGPERVVRRRQAPGTGPR
jgi:hypothetical protein